MARIAYLLIVLLLGALAGARAQQPPTAGSAANVVGRVELVEGDVTVFARTRVARRVRVGDLLHEDERIVTGRNGELHLAMDDGGYLAVRPNTDLTLVAYQARGGDDDKSVLNLVAGSFRSITGWIGRHNARSYQVRTPTATIGIRGTDHEPLVIPDGAADGEPGTYDKVNAGGTVLETRNGRIEVGPNRAGFAPLRGQPAPRLLAEVPRFYRATRNESRLAQKHQAITKSADRLREERRRLLDGRRSDLKARSDERKVEQRQERVQQRKERDDRERHKGQSDDERRKGVQGRADERREQQQKQREQRSEEKRAKTAERSRERDDAPRGRNRD
jgi:hypothetical protein